MTVENFDQVKTNFLAEFETTVKREEIPPEMAFNWNQTGVHLAPTSSWTVEKQGAKHVEVAEMTNTRQNHCSVLWKYHGRVPTCPAHLSWKDHLFPSPVPVPL